MDNIIPLRPIIRFEAQCPFCDYAWQATISRGMKVIQCPHCDMALEVVDDSLSG